MLSDLDAGSKDQDRFREEAVARIPLYSKDWTNYNVSDPGITILENLAAFMALQQSEIDEVPDQVRLQLLRLVGFKPRTGQAAVAHIMPDPSGSGDAFFPPRRMKLYAQDICFELEHDAPVRKMGILGICADGKECARARQLLDRDGIKGGMQLLGAHPAGGAALSFYVEDLPDAGQAFAIYFGLVQRSARNPILPGMENPFARICWEIRTGAGYERIPAEDGTGSFLQSGYVTFLLDSSLRSRAARSGAARAYELRMTLLWADYDLTPVFERISGLLVRAVQRDTRSDVVHLSPSPDGTVRFSHALLPDGYLEVYGKGADGLYHRCHDPKELDIGGLKDPCGQMYQTRYAGADSAELIFGADAPSEVLAVCRDKTVMAYSRLGILYGYDDQQILIPDAGAVCPGAFSVLVGDAQGYHLVRPDAQEPGEVRYSIAASADRLIIHDCGDYEGAQLCLGEFALYEGDGGNIRVGTVLSCGQEGWRFVNDTDVADGCFPEGLEQVRARFAADLAAPGAMVTQRDCEAIVKSVPGLSIHKVGVCAVPEKNELRIAVMPDSEEAFPKLSAIYKREILSYLERYRMLTTRIRIEQPVYVPIHVTGTFYIKRHYERFEEQIRAALEKMLDGIHSEAGFGDRIVFHELYRCLERLDCVDGIHGLAVFADDSRYADRAGLDICLKPNALYHPGRIRIERIAEGPYAG